MRIFKSPRSPYLQADITDPRTNRRTRISTNETTKGAAREAASSRLRVWQREADAGLEGRGAITLDMAVRAYVGWLEVLGKPSATLLAGTAKKLLGASTGRWWIDGKRWLHDLTPTDLDNLVTARTTEGNSPQTIAHEIKLLRAATLRAGSLGFRTPEITDWRLPALPTKTRYLSMEEFKLVYDYLSPDRPVATKSTTTYALTGQRYRDRQDTQDLLVCLAMTGGRWQEVARLTWSQIDLTGRVIRIYAGKTSTERLVPIPDMAFAVLTRRAVNGNSGGIAPVFPGVKGGFRSVNSCQPILKAMTAVGLNSEEVVRRHGKATVHSLRHTFASLLLQAGAALPEVQDALGHATLNMTRRYAHLSKQKSAARLGSILNEVTS
jgi:integrase